MAEYKSLGVLPLPAGTVEHDFAMLTKFQDYSAELLRLALLGITAIGIAVSLTYAGTTVSGNWPSPLQSLLIWRWPDSSLKRCRHKALMCVCDPSRNSWSTADLFMLKARKDQGVIDVAFKDMALGHSLATARSESLARVQQLLDEVCLDLKNSAQWERSCVFTTFSAASTTCCRTGRTRVSDCRRFPEARQPDSHLELRNSEASSLSRLRDPQTRTRHRIKGRISCRNPLLRQSTLFSNRSPAMRNLATSHSRRRPSPNFTGPSIGEVWI
jgi:hypothetical protein